MKKLDLTRTTIALESYDRLVEGLHALESAKGVESAHKAVEKAWELVKEAYATDTADRNDPALVMTLNEYGGLAFIRDMVLSQPA